MTIVRDNTCGYLIEVELSDEELERAHDEFDRRRLRQQIQDVADSLNIELPNDFPFDKIIADAAYLRSKDEGYMAAYWLSIKQAVQNALEQISQNEQNEKG